MRPTVLYLFFYLVLTTFLGSTVHESHAQTIHVALPDTFVTETESVMIPVMVSDVSSLGILSFGFTISFDPAILTVEDIVAADGIAADFFFSTNLDLSGQVAIAAAGIDSLKGEGPFFYLQVDFLQNGSSEMNFHRASFAEEAFEVVAQNGRLRNISLAGIGDTGEVPSQLIISQNYPNPFSTTSTIAMDLPELAQVSVNIYNLSGQLKGTFPPRPVGAGTNQLFIVEASSLPAGSYYYRVVAQSRGTIRTGTGTLTIIH